MSSNERLAIVLAVLLVISLIPWRLILWRMVGRSARKTLIIVTLVVITWGLGNSLTRWDRTFPGWFFATNNEFAFGAMMSSLMLMLAGVAALLNAIIPRQIDPGAASSAPTLPSPLCRGRAGDGGWGVRAARLPWLLMAVSFLFMGLDEYYSIHEASDIWNTIYPFNGVILVLLGVVIYVQERDFVVPFFLVIGVGMIGFGGVILDEFSNEVPLSLGIVTLSCTYKIQGIFCTDLSIVEELFELAGGGMALVGFVAYAEKHQTLPRWKLTRWAVTGFAAFWVLWMVSHTWLVPTITARIQADPVIVEYMNGALELQSYRLSQNVAAPGDTVDVTLYFRAGEVLTEDYYLSVHLLAHPDVKSMAQADTQLGDYDYPTSAWLPLVSVKSVITLKLPKNLPTPASYWVMVRVWQGPDLTHNADEPITPESEGPRIPVTNTDRQLLAPDTVVVAALPVLGEPTDSQPPTASDYRFNNGIRLDGSISRPAAHPARRSRSASGGKPAGKSIRN